MSYPDIVTGGGVFLILLAFFLNTFNFISTRSQLYLGLNFIGSGFAAYGSVLIDSVPFFVLEITWMIVSLVAFIRLIRSK